MDKIIEDIFSRYQIRKTGKQKKAFIDYATEKARELGYSVAVEKGAFGVRNIVVGSPERAKVVYTAHYDTCVRLPFPNFLTPENISLYLLYNLAVVAGFMIIAGVVGFIGGIISALLNLSPSVASALVEVAYIFLLLLMLFGPANKHTANDNTSGIAVLFGIMKALPEEQRSSVAFVFFDQEEGGLLGSAAFASKHKLLKQNTLLVNFDCVSDGKDFLIVTKKGAKPYAEQLSKAYAAGGDFHVGVKDKAFYPSDQMNFKKGVGVAAFKRTKGGILYIDRIHTNKDTVFCRENIDFLIDGSVKLAENL